MLILEILLVISLSIKFSVYNQGLNWNIETNKNIRYINILRIIRISPSSLWYWKNVHSVYDAYIEAIEGI